MSGENPRKQVKESCVSGLYFALAQALMFLTMACMFRLGLTLVETERMPFGDIYKIMLAFLFGGMAAGRMAGMLPDQAKANLGSERFFYMKNRESEISLTKGGKKLEKKIQQIEFKNINFSYPSRPGAKVLKGINMTISAGETVALVGHAGCGKSTIIQLLERFYDADSGSILVNGVKIEDLDLPWWRQQIGFVQQEPILINSSIADNIRSGQGELVGEIAANNYKNYDPEVHPKPSQEKSERVIENELSMNQVQECAKTAMAHDFVVAQALGYDTVVGRGGGQLSGGQKQRIAIARTLMRHPKILLLDEATSALDAENEKLVNQALNFAREDRTVILIAHRLSTVRSADRIIAIDSGVVVETGTHEELCSQKGYYYNLIKAQL